MVVVRIGFGGCDGGGNGLGWWEGWGVVFLSRGTNQSSETVPHLVLLGERCHVHAVEGAGLVGEGVPVVHRLLGVDGGGRTLRIRIR